MVAGAGLVLGPQPRHGIRPEVAALTSAPAHERVLPEIPQGAAQPAAQWNAKAHFGPIDVLGGDQLAREALEQVLLMYSVTQLEVGR